LRCEWSHYIGTLNTSIQFIYHERMLSSKLSQDLVIMVQHQNLVNNIKFKKKREIGRSIYNVTTNIAKIAIWLIMPKLKNQNDTHWKVKSKQNCKTNTNIDQMFYYNKWHRVGYWVCQCVWGIINLVLCCPCKFARKFWIFLFPLDKILKSISWNDRNFNMFIKTMPKCNMKQPCDMILLEWSKKRWLHGLLQSSN
jgi:hypothetical protein